MNRRSSRTTLWLLLFLICGAPLGCGGGTSGTGIESSDAGATAGDGCVVESDQSSCSAGLYCEFSAGACGEDGGRGECQLPPEVCIEIFAPVCGCDNKSYGNSCEASAAGVSVRSDGACPT